MSGLNLKIKTNFQFLKGENNQTEIDFNLEQVVDFNFREFCLGLKGLTEQEAGQEILKKLGRLANDRNFGSLTETEKMLNQDWDTQLRSLYHKINPQSKRMFNLDMML